MEKLKAFIETEFAKEIRERIDTAPREGATVTLPTLNPAIRAILEEDGITSLYGHQSLAYESIREDNHTLLVSSTASGKTLSFFLPILENYLAADQPFATLFLYPTKALSRDQEGTFGRLMAPVKKSGKLGTFDGDTPQDERSRIQRSADFIITNPDMLHGGILPNHNRQWKDMLTRLKYVVVDEVHVYRGAFGSHVANVFRRLRRVCRIHGSDPIFICSSATIGNPGDHARGLFQEDFRVIDVDNAPRPGRTTYFLNPSLVQSQGHALYRRGPGSVSVKLIRQALKLGIRTIVFCRARQEVERLYRAVIDGHPGLAGKVKPYRGGLLPTERRALERELADGKLGAIISTNALELGIDIGSLDLCVIQGHPGTIASFKQQAGRVGRSGQSAVVAYIARDNPLDQYIVHHPDFLEKAAVESARTNRDNPYIVLQHLPCAAHEYPLRESEPDYSEPVYSMAVEALRDSKLLVPYRESLRYAGDDFPTRGVNLRGMTDYNIVIYEGSEVIGEIDPVGARGELYRDAIYQHLGKKYISMELDLEKKLCRVEAADVDYYTEAHWERRIEMTARYGENSPFGAGIAFGSVLVNKQPKLYKKIRERTLENIGYGPITLPPFEYETTGFALRPSREWVEAMTAKDQRIIAAALYGIGYLLRHTGSLIAMADLRDIETDVSLAEAGSDLWESALYCYDAVDGGVGFAEEIFNRLNEALDLSRSIISECECGIGCPSCIPPLPPGVDSDDIERYLVETDASRQSALSLVEHLTRGTVIVPVITSVTREIARVDDLAEPDPEEEILQEKISRAADILRKKRERLH